MKGKKEILPLEDSDIQANKPIELLSEKGYSVVYAKMGWKAYQCLWN